MKIKKKLLKEIIVNETKLINENILENTVEKLLDFLVNWNVKKAYADPKFKELKRTKEEILQLDKQIQEIQPKVKVLKNFLNGEGPYGESNLKYIYDYINKS